MVEAGKIYGGYLVQPLCSARAGFPEPGPHGFWIPPRGETPQPPWAIYALAQSPSQSVSWASVCACCLWSCPWELLRREWLSLFLHLPLGIPIHWWDSPWAFSWALLAVLYTEQDAPEQDAPIHSSSSWPSLPTKIIAQNVIQQTLLKRC